MRSETSCSVATPTWPQSRQLNVRSKFNNMNSNHDSKESQGDGGKKHRRFSKITHEISDALWVKIMKLSVQLKISPKKVYDQLVLQVADAEVKFLVIKPQNGDKAGIAMVDVESRLADTSMALRDTVGLGHRYGSAEATAKLETAFYSSLELWKAAKYLSSETFYTPTDFEDMCRAHACLTGLRAMLLKSVEEEQKKTPSDQAKITGWKRRVADYEVVIRVLKRLGCSEKSAN